MFIWKPIARTLILPPSLQLILILIGAVMVWRRRRFGWLIVIVGLVSLWLLCTPYVADRLYVLAARYPALNPDRPVDAQAIVVLGGGGSRGYAPEYNGAIAEAYLLERITLAAFLARRYSLPLAISCAPAEERPMSETLSRSFGVSVRWTEGHSRDTYENARLSAKLLLPAGVRRIILVTGGAHEWRAAHEFMEVGFDVVPAPAGVPGPLEAGIFKFLPTSAGLERSNLAVYELVGEPMRRLMSALSIREKLDPAVQPTQQPVARSAEPPALAPPK